jgi:hypothetical protein
MPRLTPSELGQKRWQNMPERARARQMRAVRLATSAQDQKEKDLLAAARVLKKNDPTILRDLVSALSENFLEKE